MDIKIIDSIKPKLITEKPQLTSNDIYIPRVFTNTALFREPALHFLKFGCYTRARKGTKDYKDYWDEQTKRCREGYWVGGTWITGKHYFYLNFVQINAVPDRDYLAIHPKASRTRKVSTFPSFWEVDLRYWYTKELMEQNAEAGLNQVHMILLKTRRIGCSFKEAAEGIWNFSFLRGTKTVYYAFSDNYLTDDGIFNKVESMLNFVNEHTYWGQARLVTDNAYHKVGSYNTYEDGRKITKGRQNELSANVMDDPEKARGG